MPNQITIHKKKAKELCHVVMDAYKFSPFFSHRNIEREMCPEKLLIDEIDSKKRKARWLFFACSDMQLKNSRLYFEQYRDFYLEKPYFFDNKNLRELSNQRPNIKDESKTRIVLNAKKLLDEYRGDPLKILEKGSIEDILKELKTFHGFGIKQAKMYLIFLAKHGLADLDSSKIGPAIDSHFIKISSACGVFDFEDGIRVDKVRKYLDDLYSKITKEENLDSLTLDSAVWIMGHKLCTKSCYYDAYSCPLDDLCGGYLPIIDREDARLYKTHSIKRNKNQLTLPFSK